jgi:hypothetical protein
MMKMKNVEMKWVEKRGNNMSTIVAWKIRYLTNSGTFLSNVINTPENH